MSQEEKRPGWLSRVFGAGEEPTAADLEAELEVEDSSVLVAKLQTEVQQWRDAFVALEAEHRKRCAELDLRTADSKRLEAARAVMETEVVLSRKERDEVKSKRAADATKVASLNDLKRGLEQRVDALSGELETTRAALAKAREDAKLARAEATQERGRTASAQTLHRQALLAHEAAAKRAQEARTSLDAERAELATALRLEKGAHESDRAKHAHELKVTRERCESLERAAAEAQRLAAAESRARAELERVDALALDVLRAQLGRATSALDRALGRGARIALRAAPSSRPTSSTTTPPTTLADAVAAVERALRAGGVVRTVTIVEGVSGPTVVVDAESSADASAARALFELELAAWLSARVGQSIAVTVGRSDRPSPRAEDGAPPDRAAPAAS